MLVSLLQADNYKHACAFMPANSVIKNKKRDPFDGVKDEKKEAKLPADSPGHVHTDHYLLSSVCLKRIKPHFAQDVARHISCDCTLKSESWES